MDFVLKYTKRKQIYSAFGHSIAVFLKSFRILPQDHHIAYKIIAIPQVKFFLF